MHPVIHKVGHHARRHYHERYVKPHGVRAHIILTIDGILVSIILGLLAVGSYYAFFYEPLRDTFAMRFEETVLASGGKAEVALTVENTGKTSLKDVEVDIFFPPQFQVYSQSTETAHDAIELGALPREASMTYRFQGILLGPTGEAPVYVRMRGTDGFGETDERFVAGTLEWKTNRLELAWDLPETTLSGQDIPVRLKLRHLGDIILEDTTLKLDLPEGFDLRISSPPLSENAIALGDIVPGEELELTLTGAFSSAPEAPAAFGATLKDNSERLLSEAGTFTTVIDVDLRLEASFDEPDGVIRPGDEVAFTITYENDSEHVLTDFQIRLPLDVRHADFSRSVATDGARAGSSLAWGPATLDALETLEPGASGTVSGTIRVLDRISRYSTNPSLTLEPEATFDLETYEVDDARLFSGISERKISGDLLAAGVARYFTNEGDQIGRGPLPPRVGAATRYWAVFKAETGAAEVQNARLLVRLPAHVRWTGKAAVTAGFEIQEAEGGSLLIWNLGTIGAHAGEAFAPPNASLELALTPNDSHIGTAPELILGATLTGTDAWTGLELSSTQGALTTELSTDPYIRDRTVVRP